jgi:hypothetical protein
MFIGSILIFASGLGLFGAERNHWDVATWVTSYDVWLRMLRTL